MAAKIEQTTINVNRIIGDNYWFFAHDGERIIHEPTFVEMGTTESSHQLFVADTEQECLDEIQNLDLNA
jgi:hypothetical protein